MNTMGNSFMSQNLDKSLQDIIIVETLKSTMKSHTNGKEIRKSEEIILICDS